MIREAIDRLLDLAKPTQIEVGERVYRDSSYTEVRAEHDVEALEVRTLTGLIDYVKSNFDTTRDMMIHVLSPTKVVLIDQLNQTKDRRCYVKAAALLPDVKLNRWVERESFQINLQANFCDNTDKLELLQIVSSMTIKEGATIKDNGITQEVTVKQGVELELIDLKENYELLPFRTFVEIEQPASKFIFRVRENGKEITCGLFEADGGAWELNAMHSIKEYLKNELTEKIGDGSLQIIS